MSPASSLPPTKVVILAAGVGSRIRPLTDDCHKCLLAVAGTPILERMIRNIQACGLTEFVFVLGYRDDQIRTFVRDRFPDLVATFIVNDRYRHTNTGYSLMLAQSATGGAGFVKFDADVVFDPAILHRLITGKEENALCIDRNIKLDAEEVKVVVDGDLRVLRASKAIDPGTAMGESIGIEKISAAAASLLFTELDVMMADNAHHQDYYEAAYERLIARDVAFHAVDITGLNWVEIDTHEDFAVANQIDEFKHEASLTERRTTGSSAILQ
jgi:choline kinase